MTANPDFETLVENVRSDYSKHPDNDELMKKRRKAAMLCMNTLIGNKPPVEEQAEHLEN